MWYRKGMSCFSDSMSNEFLGSYNHSWIDCRHFCYLSNSSQFCNVYYALRDTNRGLDSEGDDHNNFMVEISYIHAYI